MSRRFLSQSLGLALLALALTVFFASNALAQSSEASHDAATADAQPDTTSFAESLLISFTNTSGAEPGEFFFYGNLAQANNGNFYGMTNRGGANGGGVAFEMTPAGGYTLLDAFMNTSGPEVPTSGLIQGTDGNFYGTTEEGGSNIFGTMFKMTPAGAITTLHNFAMNPSDGGSPLASLVQGTDGNFYGTTQEGGAHSDGIVFQITPAGSFTLMHSFAGTADGKYPYGALVEGMDGNYYGTTEIGGANSDGAVFSISPVSPYTLTLLHSFAGGTGDGLNPYAGLVQGADGSFYGTTNAGGSGSNGIVYKITSAGVFTLLHSFAGGTADGASPRGELLLGTDGNFYVTTSSGGAHGDGAVFQMTPTSPYTVTLVHSFAGGSADGANPYSGLVQGADGNFYGGTFSGGAGGVGTTFKITPSPAFNAPVQLSASSTSLTPGQSFTMSYSVFNAYAGALPGTMNQCFATNNGGDTTGWTGVLDATPATATKSLDAPSTPGTYTYTLTCGGVASNAIALTVTPPPITFTSVTHNFGSLAVGTAATAFGIKVTNTGTSAYPFSLVFTPANGFTTANNCGASLAAGANCELVFYFTPAAAGTVSTTWSLAPESGFSYSPSNGGTLSGTGVSAGGVTLTTNGHNFGTVTDGTTSATYGTELSNSTSAAVTLTMGSLSGTEFTVLTNCGATLAAGSNCELEFNFKPTTPGIVQSVYTLSASPTGITSGGAPLPNGGITLTGTGQ